MARISHVPKTGRVSRNPSHPFHLRTRPWQIQPFFIAPVLPGETMKHLLLQSRVVTDPIKNPFIGWWTEYYFFYVKHRDLDEREEFQNMVLDPSWSASSAGVTDAAAVDNHYFYGGGIDWVKHCLNRVTDEFFRNEGEATAIAAIDGLPLASITGNTWLDSVANDADYAPVQDLNLDANADDTITAGEADMVMAQWQHMRAAGITEMSYEDYLATYGIRPRREEHHTPELVRFVRQWSYPTNTVEPSSGAPSSAVSWSIAERADKDRFLKEPGFLFGVTVCRPKVYLSGQAGSVTTLLDGALPWLPAVMMDRPETSLRKVAASSGPLPAVTDTGGYWVDVRDLFMYGEQFVNFALSETDAGLVALPTAGLQKRYPSSTDADALFAGDNKLIRQDGVVNVSILGRQVDYTAQH